MCSRRVSHLRPCGWQFSSPCNHNDILRSASKWLISLRALWRFSYQNKSACSDVSSGEGDFCWDPEHHSCFTSRMFSSREGKIVALLTVDTQKTLFMCTILSDPAGNSSVFTLHKNCSQVLPESLKRIDEYQIYCKIWPNRETLTGKT